MGESNLTKALVCKLVDNLQSPMVVIHTVLKVKWHFSTQGIAKSGYIKHLLFYICYRKIYQCSNLGHSIFQILEVTHYIKYIQLSSVQLLSCVQFCDPMGWSTSGLPVHHQLLEFTQTHVYWVGDAIQLSHPLLSPSPPAFNISQHQGLFSNESALPIRWPKALEFQL